MKTQMTNLVKAVVKWHDVTILLCNWCGRTTVHYVGNDWSSRKFNQTRRDFYKLFNGMKRVKPDMSRKLITENLWNYDGPRTNIARYYTVVE